MFENYLYVGEDKMDCYLSDFSCSLKIKGKTVDITIIKKESA